MTKETDQTQNKPATQTAKIIAFKPPKSTYILTCPDCDGVSFELIMVDIRENMSLTTLNCVNLNCDYWTQAEMQMGEDHYE